MPGGSRLTDVQVGRRQIECKAQPADQFVGFRAREGEGRGQHHSVADGARDHALGKAVVAAKGAGAPARRIAGIRDKPAIRKILIVPNSLARRITGLG